MADIVDDAPINKMLPKELLLRVFSYLDVVSLCRSAQVKWQIEVQFFVIRTVQSGEQGLEHPRSGRLQLAEC